MDHLDRRKLLSVLSHSAIVFSLMVISILISIAILRASNDPVVKENAKESRTTNALPLSVYFSIVLSLIALS